MIKKFNGNEIEKGKISLCYFASTLTAIWECTSDERLGLGEARILLHNTAEVRKFILGKRDFNVLNYRPMPIERELEQAEYFYRRLVLNGIISDAKNGIYPLDTLDDLWKDFCLSHKFDYDELSPGWNDGALATKAKNALAKILVKILEEELDKKTSEKRRDQLMFYLGGVKACYNFSDSMSKKITELMKKFDPKNKYEYKWAGETI